MGDYAPPLHNQHYANKNYSYRYYPEHYTDGRGYNHGQAPYAMYNNYIAPGQYAYYDSRISSDAYIRMKDVPATLECPKCGKYVQTIVKSKTSTRTLAASAALATIFWPLAFLPFATQMLKKTVHVCPCCNYNLGKIVTVTSKRPYRR
ncbi:hypothetical protein GGI05_005112 [Coemansia sp. RSA 2603]|nr:hypothetical protein GGI05_005112 [Coemansia sp. RSA 2603]